MSAVRPEEEWARQMVRAALSCSVVVHDDNSVDGMYDLHASLPNGRSAAIEVTSAPDAEALALWKLVNGPDRLIYPHLRGGWMVELAASTRAKPLLRALPSLLTSLESQGITDLPYWTTDYEYARSLGVVRMRQSATDFNGSVYFLLDLPSDRVGGVVAADGNALPRWLTQWLGEPERADVVRKLARAHVVERHVFVLVPGLTVAPFDVADLLMRDGAPMPSEAPHLPEPISQVWVASTWSSGCGFCWSATQGWNRFDKLQELSRSA
jgi:hypothetical protein